MLILMIKMSEKHVNIALGIWYFGFIYSMVVFIALGPLFGNLLFRESELVTFALYYMTVFNCRTW